MLVFENIRNLKIKETVYADSPDCITVRKRPNHILVTRLSGKCAYCFNDTKIIIGAGESILLPYGCGYSVRRISEEPSRYALLRFTAEADFEGPSEFSVDDIQLFKHAFDRLGRSLVIDNEKNVLLATSLFYEILSLLSPKSGHTYLNSGKLQLIKPALEYLEEHIYDTKLVIGDLSKLCNISDVYLRQIFFSYTGKTLSQYVTEKRMNKAKMMLDEGDCILVRDAAEATGYANPLYFSRVFKKYYGYPPSSNSNNV